MIVVKVLSNTFIFYSLFFIHGHDGGHIFYVRMICHNVYNIIPFHTNYEKHK